MIFVSLESQLIPLNIPVHILAHTLILEVFLVQHIVVLLYEHLLFSEALLHVYDQLFQLDYLWMVLLNCVVQFSQVLLLVFLQNLLKSEMLVFQVQQLVQVFENLDPVQLPFSAFRWNLHRVVAGFLFRRLVLDRWWIRHFWEMSCQEQYLLLQLKLKLFLRFVKKHFVVFFLGL